MAEYLDNAAGITTTTGTGDLVISNSIDQYGPIIGRAVNGVSYPYYIKYVDVADGADYETGLGTWDSGTSSLSRDTITTSSNSGSAVNWGPGQKAVFITADKTLSTDMDQMINGSSKLYMTPTQAASIAASKTKTDLITITQAVDLDQMEADIAAFSGGMTYRGNWDASTGVFPGAGVGSNGDYWYCSVSGVVDTVTFDAGDSIVALVNNPSISTFAGNWTRHDSLDAVRSVAGLTGTITADDLNAALGLPLFPGTQEGEPVLFVGTGQSNWLGIYAVDIADMPSNSRVYDWQYTRQSGSSALFSFAVANPVRTVLNSAGGAYDGAALVVGMHGSSGAILPGAVPAPGQPSGHIGWACLNELTTRYRNDFFMVNVAKNGEAISYWASGAAGEAALADHVPAAIAEINTMGYPVAITAPHRVFWLQGETNKAVPTAPETYATDWLAFKALCETKWAENGFTQWVICDIGEDYYSVGEWPAFARIIEQTANDVQIVSSIGIPETFDVTLHFTGPGLNAYGVRAADVVDAPGTARTFNSPEASQIQWQWGGAVSTVPNGASAVGYIFDTEESYVTAGAKIASIRNNGVEVAYVLPSGAINVPDFFLMDFGAGNMLTAAPLYLGDILGTNTGTFTSSIANSGTNVAYSWDTANTFTGTTKLANWKNNTVEKAYITPSGGFNAASFMLMDFGGNILTVAPMFLGNTVTTNTGNFASAVAAANNAVGFVFNVSNDLSAFSNTFLLDLQRGGTSRLKVDATGSLQMLNGGVLSGTLSGTGAISTSGAIGTSSTMTAAGLTCAAGTVSAQHLIGTSSLTLNGLAGTGTRAMAANASGVAVAIGWDWTTATATVQTTNATPASIYIGGPADGAREVWEAIVTGNRQTTAGTICSEHVFTITRVGGTCTVSSSSEIKKVTTGTGSTCAVATTAFGAGFLITVTGNAAETWDWKTEYRYRSIA